MELLAPAGSFEALKAAVSAGADAVYFGGEVLNARMYSKNFTNSEIEEAAAYCRAFGVKTYLTLNTLVSDKELKEIPTFLENINRTAIDGVIVQDLGIARLMRACVPYLPIHASTQMTLHSLHGVQEAAKLGFSRVVVSRELPKSQLQYICQNAPVEIEAFIHGSLCMCYSGQCYLSSVIGGRSGNRGRCAQPCRKVYENGYELSLKDLCMAQNFTSFLECGVHSLKIEGRMKSPAYVAGVVQVYRRLIDEKRNATSKEIECLEALFSRNGFTNAYFQDAPSRQMFGIRTDSDKQRTKTAETEYIEPKIKIKMRFCAQKDKSMRLSIQGSGKKATVEGEVPSLAERTETTVELCKKQLLKLGGTKFEAEDIDCVVEAGIFIPVAALNRLRRACVEALEEALNAVVPRPFIKKPLPYTDTLQQNKIIFYCQTMEQARKVGKYADEIWLPLFKIKENVYGKTCAVLPPILFDRDEPAVEEKMLELREEGICSAVCSNIGQFPICRKVGYEIIGGVGLNVYNAAAIQALAEMGVKSAVLSFEANTAQIRDMKRCIQTNIIVYGRYPVMTIENCIMKNRDACIMYNGYGELRDETGRSFPVFCTYPHRNIIYNAIPLYMGDKKDELPEGGRIFLFTTESGAEAEKIWNMYQNGEALKESFTRGFFRKKI